MNEIVNVKQSEAFVVRGVLPDSIIAKIKKEQADKENDNKSSLDLTRNENRDVANFVCREFEISLMRDDYRDFADLVNQTVKTKNEIARLFNVLNGSPLGLHFMNKLNLDTLQKEDVRAAFIAWAKKLMNVLNGIEELDQYICMAYNAILEDQKIHPTKEWDHASDLIKIVDNNHSAKVFATYNHIWDILQQTKTKKGDVLEIIQDITSWGATVSQAQLGQLYTELLQSMKNSIHTLTDDNIIEPLIRDKSSILTILESYADRTIGNMEYLRWTRNDRILDEILDYLLSYYHRLIIAISEKSCFDSDDKDTFAIKDLMERFIILHKGADLRIKALNAIDTQSDLSIFIVDRFLQRKLNYNIKRDDSVMEAERNVKERALQIYENILKDENIPLSKRVHIERNLANCILNESEDYQIRNYGIDIICNTRPLDIAFDKIKGILENVILIEASTNEITQHCPTCRQTVMDRTVQERALHIYENVLKDDGTHNQLKGSIERQIEMLILDDHEDVETRKLALNIVCCTRGKEDAFCKTKGFLVKIIENQGRIWATTRQCPNCGQKITDDEQMYCVRCRCKLK